jgi:hypothetical protein
VRRGETVKDSPARRARLRQQYARQVHQLKTRLPKRARCHLLVLDHGAIIRDPQAAAHQLNRFLGGQLAVDAMTAEVKPDLHRQRAGTVAPLLVS